MVHEEQKIQSSAHAVGTHAERIEAAVDMLGADVGEVGDKAAQDIRIMGKNSETQAKVAGMDLQSTIDQAGQQQSALLHAQEARRGRGAQARRGRGRGAAAELELPPALPGG